MLVKFKDRYNVPSVWNHFDNFFGKDFPSGFEDNFKSIPAVNVKETNESFELEMAAPGLKKEDFKLNLHNDMLEVTSEMQNEKTENEENFTRREFNFNSFKRSFTIPETVDASKISAQYANGILKIQLPKKPEAKVVGPKEIKIS